MLILLPIIQAFNFNCAILKGLHLRLESRHQNISADFCINYPLQQVSQVGSKFLLCKMGRIGILAGLVVSGKVTRY